MKRAKRESPRRQRRPATPRKPRVSGEDVFNEVIGRELQPVTDIVQASVPTIDAAIVQDGVQRALIKYWRRLRRRRQLRRTEDRLALLIVMARRETVRLAKKGNRLTPLHELPIEPADEATAPQDYQFFYSECDVLRGQQLPKLEAALEPELFGPIRELATEEGRSEAPHDVFDFVYGFLWREEMPCATPRKQLMKRLCVKLGKKRNTIDKELSRARQRYLAMMGQPLDSGVLRLKSRSNK